MAEKSKRWQDPISSAATSDWLFVRAGYEAGPLYLANFLGYLEGFLFYRAYFGDPRQGCPTLCIGPLTYNEPQILTAWYGLGEAMIIFVNKSSSEDDEFRGRSEELHSRHHHVTCRCLSQVLGLPGPHSLLQGMVKGGILKLGNKKTAWLFWGRHGKWASTAQPKSTDKKMLRKGMKLKI